MANLIEVTPRQAAEAIRVALAARRPVMLHGQPGTGKSAIMSQVADTMFAEQHGVTIDRSNGATVYRDPEGGIIHPQRRPYFRDERLSLKDAVDVNGLPYVDMVDGIRVSRNSRPAILPFGGCGIIFFDEINRAPALTQSAALQLIYDRAIGDHVLGDGWLMVAAGNYESDGGGVQRLISAMGGRFVHLYIVPDLDDWCAWALANGVSPLIVAHLKFRPQLLHLFDKTADANPSPRTWEFASQILAQNPPESLELALFGGCVGQGAAIELMAFLKVYRSLPDLDAAMMSPDTAFVPSKDQISALWATSAGIAARINKTNFANAARYLERLPAEFNLFAVQSALQRDDTFSRQGDRAWLQWAAKYMVYV